MGDSVGDFVDLTVVAGAGLGVGVGDLVEVLFVESLVVGVGVEVGEAEGITVCVIDILEGSESAQVILQLSV